MPDLSELLAGLDLELVPTLDGGFSATLGAETTERGRLPPAAGTRTTAPGGADVDETSRGEPLLRVGRFEVVAELGRGGMGRVLAARDPDLGRLVAVKVVLDPSRVRPNRLARFVAEAQITAQLEHPNIVPVHEIGVTGEGRLFYVMKKVEGRSLREILDLLREDDSETVHDWTRPRLLGAFVQVCNAVAWAHSRGVLHRDLKPANVMLGRFGEVLVLDWGVARLVGDETEVIEIERLEVAALARTLDGATIGTPGWISPEQLSGKLALLDARSDVWSLGAILYEILTLQAPYEGSNVLAVTFASMAGPPEPPHLRVPELRIPVEISEVCTVAMQADPRLRPTGAEELAERVQQFLEGSRRRQRARLLVDEARSLRAAASERRVQAAQLRGQAEELLGRVPSWAPSADKRPGWQLEDAAARLEEEADQAEVRFLQTARSALEQTEDLAEAHELLADHFQARHAEAEARGDSREAARLQLELEAHDRGRHAAWLEGIGALTLHTEPAGARTRLLRFVEHGRRLVPEEIRSLGRTPLDEVPLPMGSYLLELEAEGRELVRFPVHIGRGERWHGAPPGATGPAPVPLPPRGSLAMDERYVPPGWFIAGGDDEAANALPRQRLWCDGFVMRRYPVTNREYLATMNRMVAEGRAEAALALAPRERGSTEGPGNLIYGRHDDGAFFLQPDADGDVWLPDWPVVMVDWNSAVAFAAEAARYAGLPWRLPLELELEKAARGVDGRFHPWGDRFDPSWCCMRDSHQGPRLLVGVDRFPLDESPYGVRGLAGNSRTWCLDLEKDGALTEEGRVRRTPRTMDPEAGNRVVRGGGWSVASWYCRAAYRYANKPSGRNSLIGLRLVRPL